jgi:hypothetical protein
MQKKSLIFEQQLFLLFFIALDSGFGEIQKQKFD